MKKVLLIAIAAIGFSTFSNAQQIPAGAESRQPLTKEEREMRKIKTEADLVASFKEVGLDEGQQKAMREAMQNASAKSMELRKDATLDEESKKAKQKELNEARNAEFKKIMGDEKYSKWEEIRKAQREEAKKNQPAMPAKE